MSDASILVCLRCKATVDMGCCLCPDGRFGETAWITWDEHTAWRGGVLPAVLTDVAAPAAHSPVIDGENSRAEPLNPSETNHG